MVFVKATLPQLVELTMLNPDEFPAALKSLSTGKWNLNTQP